MVPNIPDVLLTRLAQLESEQTIRQIMSQYMHLCDDLSDLDVVEEIGNLFTPNAIWEGVGDLYCEKLGRHVGRENIVRMMNSYVSNPSHFKMNVHLLASEYIELKHSDRAVGRWKMLQMSTFSSSVSYLNCAEIIVKFESINSNWQIVHFTTRNLFSRPVNYWDTSSELPVPDIENQ